MFIMNLKRLENSESKALNVIRMIINQGGLTRDPQTLVARPLGRWEDVPEGSGNQKTTVIGGRGKNF